MLTFRLTGTTEATGSTTTNPPSLFRHERDQQQQNGAESSLTMVSLEDGAVLLTCGNRLFQ